MLIWTKQSKPDLQQVTKGVMSSQGCSIVASFSGNTCYNISCCGVLFGLVLNFAGFMFIQKKQKQKKTTTHRKIFCVLTRISICASLWDYSLALVLLTYNFKVMDLYFYSTFLPYQSTDRHKKWWCTGG